MNVLIAVAGSEDDSFFTRIARLLPSDASRVLLVHVVDSRPRGDLELGRGRIGGHHPLSAQRSADLERAETERAEAGLRYAHQALVDSGIPPETMHELVLHGKPNEELRALAERERVDLVVVGGRGGKPGPHSIGKTARFLIDHAPRTALLVR